MREYYKAEFEKIYPLSKLSDDELVQHAISHKINEDNNLIRKEEYVKSIDLTADEFIKKYNLTSLEDVIKLVESKL